MNVCRFVTIAATSLVLACTDAPQTTPATVLTLFDIQEQIQAGTTVLSPGNIGVRGRYTRQFTGISLDPVAAFAEGEPAAYVTTEYWFGFSKVWVQPLYIPARRNPMTGGFDIVPGTMPIFGVGPDSAFYSPYWEVFWVLVPQGVTPDLRSTADVLNSGYELVPGPGSLCSLSPGPIQLTNTMHPLLGTNIASQASTGQGWVDGHEEPMAVVAFGFHRFTWDDNGVVDEDPLYTFRSVNAAGSRVVANLPSVGGIAASNLFARQPATNNQPSFGSLWRLYFVDLPANTHVLGPPAQIPPNPRDEADVLDLTTAGIQVVRVPANDPNLEALRPYFYRVIHNSACITAADGQTRTFTNALPTAPEATRCVYLDSQERIETLVPSYLVNMAPISATCPYVTYMGKPVAPPPGMSGPTP